MKPLLDARVRRRLVAHDITESVVPARKHTADCGHTFTTFLPLPQVPLRCPECWVAVEMGS